jgi:hypothetical protein
MNESVQFRVAVTELPWHVAAVVKCWCLPLSYLPLFANLEHTGYDAVPQQARSG